MASRSGPGELDLILLLKPRAPARPGFGTIVAVVALLFMSPRPGECIAGFGRNALVNGDFAKLHDELPVAWRVSGAPGSIRAEHQASALPELEIANAKPAAGGFAQRVYLDDGWYVLDGEVRTEQVSAAGAGALLRIELQNRRVVPAPEIHGSHRWQTIEVYFKMDHWDCQATVACILGRKGQLSAGRAFFRNIRLVRVRTQPPPTAAQFDLHNLPFPSHQSSPQTGTPWSVALAVLASGALALTGWRLIGSRPRSLSVRPECADAAGPHGIGPRTGLPVRFGHQGNSSVQRSAQ